MVIELTTIAELSFTIWVGKTGWMDELGRETGKGGLFPLET